MNATSFRDLTDAGIIVHGPHGGTFASGTVTFLIWEQNTEGGFTYLGSDTDDGFDMGVHHESPLLGPVFAEAGVSPITGQLYQVSVQESSVSLGSTTFTYTGF